MRPVSSHKISGTKEHAKAPAPAQAHDFSADPNFAVFIAALEPVLVESGDGFEFPGAIKRAHARSVWTWYARDIDEHLKTKTVEDDAAPEILLRSVRKAIKEALEQSKTDPGFARRFGIQIGGEDVLDRLPIIQLALRSIALLQKAVAFGRATNNITDEASISLALQSMPLGDPALSALLLHAAVSQVANPDRLINAAINVVGAPTDSALRNAGFAPLVDAILAHAQEQIECLSARTGPFVDIDLMCRVIDRFHKLIRAIHGYVEMEPRTRWPMIVAEFVKLASAKVEPRLREVSSDVMQSLRRHRGSADKLDSDRLLAALNGVYLLVAVRDSRESLALNTLFEQTWRETGQALEILIARNLEAFKEDTNNEIVGQRLDTAIKMAALRFNDEYAEILQRARDSAERRVGQARA